MGEGSGEGQSGVSCGFPEEQEISCGLGSECGGVAGQGGTYLVEGEEVETLARAREKVLMGEPVPRALRRLVLQATRVLPPRAAPWKRPQGAGPCRWFDDARVSHRQRCDGLPALLER